jgi:hypothetical protein
MNRFFNFLVNLSESEYKSKEALIMKLYGPHMDLTKEAAVKTKPADSVKTFKKTIAFSSMSAR